MLEKLYALLEGEAQNRMELWVRLAIQGLILANVAAVVLQTVESIGRRHADAFLAFEWFSVTIFAVEYVARLAACTVDPFFRRPLAGRVRFALTPLAIVDLVAIAPAFLPMLGLDLRSMRALRLIRIFRVLKLGRYSRAVNSLGSALQQKLPEIAVATFALLVVLVLASTVLYYAEFEAQPEAFSSIPAAAWWAIATLTTVGYGDIAPITPLGKLSASVVAVLGIGLFAIPAGLLGSAFVSQLQDRAVCPHCGEEI